MWVSVIRERLERARHQAEQAWTTFSVAETRLVAAREARNASGREWMMRVDGGEGAERDTRDAAPVSSGEVREQPHRSSPSDPTRKEIEDHVLTGHARFWSWCAACARERGRAEGHRGDGQQGGRGRLWNPSSVMALCVSLRWSDPINSRSCDSSKRNISP